MFSLAKSRLREDDGVALITAVTVMVVALGLALLVAQVAITTNRDSGVDRQRAVSINAAEAGLDAEFISLQTAPPGQLPCPGSLLPLSIQVPDNPSVTRTISYTDLQGNPITDCNILQSNSQRQSVRAVVTSTANPIALAGVSVRRTRVMQATITLNPVLANGFQNAIFANANLTVKNRHNVYGNQGDDANIYSNGDVSCPTGSNQTYHGNLFAQGAITFDGQCSVSGDTWAKNAVALNHNQTTVGGRVISSTSSVTIANINGVAGNVMAGTSISPTSCVSPKCTRNLVQAAPPAQPFPQIKKTSPYIDQWMAATTANPPGLGYTRVDDNNCASILSDLSTYAHDSQGRSMLVVTTCSVSFSSQDLVLYNNLAIFADGGFQSSQQVTMKSGDGAAHNLYWIVPYDRSGPACASTTSTSWSNGDIYTGQKFGVDPTVQMMMYTPCNASIQNHVTQFGQIYAGGSATVDNQFDMDFRPLPVVGIDPSSVPILSYNVDINYKREVRG